MARARPRQCAPPPHGLGGPAADLQGRAGAWVLLSWVLSRVQDTWLDSRRTRGWTAGGHVAGQHEDTWLDSRRQGLESAQGGGGLLHHHMGDMATGSSVLRESPAAYTASVPLFTACAPHHAYIAELYPCRKAVTFPALSC
jgi:hypothetical protein